MRKYLLILTLKFQKKSRHFTVTGLFYIQFRNESFRAGIF